MISIIIPAYNAGKYLEACLESIVSQKCCDYEVILVDDGSNDNTREIVLKWKKKCSSIKYFYQNNLGQGSAREYGTTQAEGEWLFFLDADDELVSDALSYLQKSIKTDVDLIWFEYGLITEHSYHYIQIRPELKDKRTAMQETTTFLWDKLIRKSLWEKKGIKLSNLYGEDIMPIYLLLAEVEQIQIIHMPFVLHYERTDNLSSDGNRVKQITESVDQTIQEFIKRNLFQEYRFELLAMIRKQYRWFQYDRKWDDVSQIIVSDLKKIMMKYFPHEYEDVIYYGQQNLIVIGNVDLKDLDTIWYRRVYYYECIEKYFLDKDKPINSVCHYLINIDNEVQNVIYGTRTEMWVLNQLNKKCNELLYFCRKYNIYGKLMIYETKHKNSEIYTLAEKTVKKTFQSYDIVTAGSDVFEIIKKENGMIMTNGMSIDEEGLLLDYKMDYLRANYNVNIMNKWLSMKIRGISLEKYFMENGYKRIAIYGIGYLGELLSEELSLTMVEVVCYIDKKGGSFLGKRVYMPNEKYPEFDAVIVSVVQWYEVVLKELICLRPVISLEHVISAID